MNWWFLTLPIVSACIGAFFISTILKLLFHPVQTINFLGIRIQGIVPKRQPAIAQQIGVLSASLFSIKELEEKITHPDNVKKIMPQAEEHIDHFLRVKLVQSMPVVGMFVGDKTISGLKSLFVAELEQLFPEIMNKYMDNLQHDLDIEKMISSKIAAIPVENIERAFLDSTQKERRMLIWMGAVMGCVIGLIQLGLMHLLAR